jgi:tetratricopeptide (TPR) repeat protein
MDYHVWACALTIAIATRAHHGWLLKLAVCSACLCLLAPAALSAQDKPSPDKQAQYRELIEKGLQEYALGHWPEARVFFGDAHTIWPNARTLRGLGMSCYEGRSYVEAIDYLERALANRIQPLTSKLETEAQGILAQAKRFVSSAYVRATPAHAELSLDDQPVKPRSNGAVLLNPGEHILQISSPGYRTELRTLHGESGRELHVQVDLRSADELQPTASSSLSLSSVEPIAEPIAASSRPNGPVRDGFASQSATAAAALSALGLAGLATGWVFYALRDDLRVELWEHGLSDEEGFEQSKFSDYQTRGGVALGAASMGAVAMSLAQYFWLPDVEPVPAWAWAAGGVGAALAVGALSWAVFGQHCEVTDRLAFCRSTLSDSTFAPMLALQSLPLLSLPIMYAVRERLPVANARLALGGSAGSTRGLQLSIAGAF